MIIKGNPKYIKSNKKADSFYEELRSFLESKGYAVKMHSGKPYSTPPKADLWVGHSRGVDRLEYAPEGTKTVALGVAGGIHHPKDNSAELDGRPPKGFKPNNFHYVLTDEMKKVLSSESIDEQGAYTSPGYGPEPDRPTERYKQGNTVEDHEPDATKKLINYVDYTQGHTSMAAAEHSPGMQAYGQIGSPKDFVPEDWEQRHWKTKEEAPMDMSQLEEMVQSIVREALDKRQAMSSLDEAIEKIVALELGEAFTGIHDDSDEGKPVGGSKAFRKNREAVLDYDEKQKPQGTEDLENYHLGDDD